MQRSWLAMACAAALGAAGGCSSARNPAEGGNDGGAGGGGPAAGDQPIDFKVLVHEIHASELRAGFPVTIVGFGGSQNVFPLGFPGQIGNCATCHTGTSYALPLQAARDTTTDSGADAAGPADDTRLGKTAAVCTSCHANVRFDGSAGATCAPGTATACNHAGGPTSTAPSGDAGCVQCHGTGAVADVAKMHPIQAPGTTAPSQLHIEIQSATVPETASSPATVTFRLTDAAGSPINDLQQEIQNAGQNPAVAPGMVPRFVLSQLEADGTYTSYYESTVAAQPYTPTGKAQVTPTGSAVQPGFADASRQGQLAPSGANDGVYTFTFPAPTTTGKQLLRTSSHKVGIWATRTVTVSGRSVASPASATYDFVPAGGTAQRFETVTDAACNRCHGQLQAHDQRTGTQLCKTCHAGDQSTPYADPESGNSIDFRSMIHKIHRGQNLPSVKNGTPFFIVGFRQGYNDYSEVGFPQDVRNCTACHAPGGANADAWKTTPTRLACGSCHDNVNFGQPSGTTACGFGVTAPCNHRGGAQATDNACGGCHNPTAITGSHAIPEQQATGNFKYQINSVTVGADRKPVVTFQVVNPTNGTPYDIKTDAAFKAPQGNSRLFVDIGWPADEYTNEGSGYVNATTKTPGPGQPVQIDALASSTPAAGQANTFQVTSPTALPAGVTTATVVLEGHPAIVDPNRPTTPSPSYLRVPVPTEVKVFDQSGALVSSPPRREVVSVESCNACHGQLSAHGANRNDRTDACVVCHNANATDREVRK